MVKMVGTSGGDGTVNWAAENSHNLPAERCWVHAGGARRMTATDDYFPPSWVGRAWRNLRLGRLPVSGGMPTWTYDAARRACPAKKSSPAAWSAAGQGVGWQRRRATSSAWRCAMDPLRAVPDPSAVITSAMRSLAPSGASTPAWSRGRSPSASGSVSMLTGEIGTSAVVLQARNDEVRKRGTGQGAVIVGLGEYGNLSASVCPKRFAPAYCACCCTARSRGRRALGGWRRCRNSLASLLIGYNSTTHIQRHRFDCRDRARRARRQPPVQRGDAQGQAAGGPSWSSLNSLPTPLSPQPAIQPTRMAGDLRRLEAHLEPQAELLEHEARVRAFGVAPFGYCRA